MQRTGLAWVLLFVMLASLSAGCLQDVERQRVEVSWEPEVTLLNGPLADGDGWPAMLITEGQITVSPARELEVTGVGGTLTMNGSSLDLQLTRLVVDGTQTTGDALDNVSLQDGASVRASWAPTATANVTLPTQGNVTVDTELRWRFREGDRFDAGRLEVATNVTARPGAGLGLGAAQVDDGTIHGLVWKALGNGSLADQVPGTARLEVFRVDQEGRERLAPVEVTFQRGEGVILADLDQGLELPDGVGYLVFEVREEGVTGTAVHSFGEVESSTPGPAAVLTLLALVGAGLALAGKRHT